MPCRTASMLLEVREVVARDAEHARQRDRWLAVRRVQDAARGVRELRAELHRAEGVRGALHQHRAQDIPAHLPIAAGSDAAERPYAEGIARRPLPPTSSLMAPRDS